jgi:hypothetical protein
MRFDAKIDQKVTFRYSLKKPCGAEEEFLCERKKQRDSFLCESIYFYKSSWHESPGANQALWEAAVFFERTVYSISPIHRGFSEFVADLYYRFSSHM